MKKRVLLVSPLPKIKSGGIGTWTRTILDYQKIHGKFDLNFINTAFSFQSNIVSSRFQRIIHGVLGGVIILIHIIIKIIWLRPKTIHYTSSGSLALLKDYFAVKIANFFQINFVIHWHFGRIPELRKKNNLEWKLLLKVAKSANTSIVLDNKSCQVLDQNKVKEVILIPNPISEDMINEEKLFAIDKKSIEIGTFVFIGHIIPAKGVSELVKACCLVNSNIKLVLIGPVSKSYKKELISFTSQIDTEFITWTGELLRHDVIKYLHTANALCLPSYTEGFPNVILEAMSTGCPVIATNVGAIKDMIFSDEFGNAGICIKPKSVELLTQALEYMISNPIEVNQFSNSGYKIVKNKYTPSKIFHEYESVW